MKIKPITLAILTASLPLTSMAAANQPTISQLSKQANQLSREVRVLKTEIRELKREKGVHSTLKPYQKTHPMHPIAHTKFPHRHARPAGTIAAGRHYTAGSAVTTSPYLGINSLYDGGDLIVNLPFVNNNLAILKQQQMRDNALNTKGFTAPSHPTLDLSGQFEGQVIGNKSYSSKKMNSDIAFATAKIDALAEINKWITGFMSITYNSAPPSPLVSGTRTANSEFELGQGFMTIGNLNHSPFYASIGQLYVPFGRYSTYFVSDPLTELLGETLARAVVVGYHPHSQTGFYGSLYGFRGDARTKSGSSINQWGADLAYSFAHNGFTGDVGTSYIHNLADSGGMQDTGMGAPAFTGFGQPVTGVTNANAQETLAHVVPGLDLHANLSYMHFYLNTEYVTALDRFAMANLSFNSRGAKPSAFHIEGGYQFSIHGKPSRFGVGYGHTAQALALGLPQNRYIAILSTSLWRDTVESLEFRHDVNYASSDTASGNGVTGTFGPAGKINNALTLDFNAYF